jgi:hypothetical protein
MKLYFPGSVDQLDYVGYNHACRLFRTALEPHIVDNPNNADWSVYCNAPFHRDPGAIRHDLPLLVYTMFESTKLPAAWVKWLNKNATVVAVPSPFSEAVFRGSGVTRPIGLLSLAVDTNTIPIVKKDRDTDRYTFLWQGVAMDKGGRKGVEKALEAFKQLRKEGRIGTDARLIVKFRPQQKSVAISSIANENSGITYIGEELTRPALIDLYRSVDCCVNPTRGEGFGLIPLEQACMGKPVLVTGFSVPYIHAGSFKAIDYKLTESPCFWNHRYCKVSWGELEYNGGGTHHVVQWLPNKLQQMADGRRVTSFPPRPISWKASMAAQINNAAMRVQGATGLYHRMGRPSAFLWKEHPGKDAEVNIEHLKGLMEWCYTNRGEAEQMGLANASPVRRQWGLERMRRDYSDNIEPLLRGVLNG